MKSARSSSAEFSVASVHAEVVELRESGNHARAAAAARRALAYVEEREGRSHPDVAAMLLELGQALEATDRWEDARHHYARADRMLRLHARTANRDIRRLQLKAARALCGVYRALGRYRLADRHGRRAIALAERSFGPRDLDLAGALNDVGMLRKYQGRYPEAAPLYRRALGILRGAGLGESADAASVFPHLGGIEHARGRYVRAEGPARRAVELRTRAFGSEHPAVAADIAALAAVLEARA